MCCMRIRMAPIFSGKALGNRYRGRKILTVHVIPDSIKGSLPAWRLFMPFVRWYFRRVYSFRGRMHRDFTHGRRGDTFP